MWNVLLHSRSRPAAVTGVIDKRYCTTRREGQAESEIVELVRGDGDDKERRVEQLEETKPKEGGQLSALMGGGI